jgi:NAD(P)-dependent dehydrogenase (short-subunit alcohol dehydrogenase family)
MQGLKDKIAIVAGAASGIGAASAHKLAAWGAKVIVADINGEGAQATSSAIAAYGGSALAFRFDVTDERSVTDLVTFALDHHGRLDGLHYNVADVALTARDTNILDIDLALWERMLRVNLTGLFLTMRQCIPHMLKQGGGAIVNTSSAAAFSGEGSIPAYSSSKAGLNALTRHVASAYGRAGIRCNAIAPGAIPTEGALAVVDLMGANGKEWYDHIRTNVAHSHRDGKPEDIASMVAFLLSDEGSWINGQCISIDGGWLFR